MKSQQGMSLVEATIILMVLATLTAVVAPSINNYTNDARQIAAKADVEAIGSGITQLLRDTGSRCLRLVGATDCALNNRVDLLVSAGALPRAITATDITPTGGTDSAMMTATSLNWQPDGDQPPAGRTDTVDRQLLDNSAGYTAASFTTGGGPVMKLGWRGAYLTGPISGDPWGTRYQANTVFLTVATNAIDSVVPLDDTQEGLRDAGWTRDVLVLSSGGNEIVETSFGGAASAGVTSGGDDIIYIIRGGTR